MNQQRSKSSLRALKLLFFFLLLDGLVTLRVHSDFIGHPTFLVTRNLTQANRRSLAVRACTARHETMFGWCDFYWCVILQTKGKGKKDDPSRHHKLVSKANAYPTTIECTIASPAC